MSKNYNFSFIVQIITNYKLRIINCGVAKGDFFQSFRRKYLQFAFVILYFALCVSAINPNLQLNLVWYTAARYGLVVVSVLGSTGVTKCVSSVTKGLVT